jgi:hypothetical protein
MENTEKEPEGRVMIAQRGATRNAGYAGSEAMSPVRDGTKAGPLATEVASG